MKLQGWKELLLAFILALVMWYGVTGSEKVESQFEVRVDYRGLPVGLVVRDGFVNKVSVRLRASAGMLRSIAGRDYAFNMSLADVHKGDNVLAINPNYLPFRSGVEVIDVSPAQIFLKVDGIESRTIPVKVELQGEISEDYSVSVTLTPPQVTISGASSVVEGIKKIELPVYIGAAPNPGITESIKTLLLPYGVDAAPSQVTVSMNISVKRKQASLIKAVQVQAGEGFDKSAQPDKVRLTLSLPESLAAQAGTLTDLRAFVQAEELPVGIHTLPVRIALPDGVELLNLDPSEVSVRLTLRNANPAQAAPPTLRLPAPAKSGKASAPEPASGKRSPAKGTPGKTPVKTPAGKKPAGRTN
ncbi:MAG: hypothetical protein LBN33_00235 [Desulfovibrio sp.]|jgi:hypothetical protein|nr:hypothetical protein [Desulfovibrio sp.]